MEVPGLVIAIVTRATVTTRVKTITATAIMQAVESNRLNLAYQMLDEFFSMSGIAGAQ